MREKKIRTGDAKKMDLEAKKIEQERARDREKYRANQLDYMIIILYIVSAWYTRRAHSQTHII